jgi:hypothetical protein
VGAVDGVERGDGVPGACAGMVAGGVGDRHPGVGGARWLGLGGERAGESGSWHRSVLLVLAVVVFGFFGWLAAQSADDGFWNSGQGLASSAAYLDQAWHWLWLFAAP